MQSFRECLGSDRRLDQHAGPAEDFSGGERRRAGHKLPNFSRGRREPSHARLIDGDLCCAGGDAIERNPAFDLAAFELGCELLAQSRLERTQFVGQLERDVEIAMIDRSQFDRQ